MKWFYFFLLLSSYGMAQDTPPIIQQQVEEWGESNETEEMDDDNILQQYEYLKKHPLNINAVTKEELKILSFLNEFQIYYLLDYRRLLGEFIHIYELQAIPGFDLATIHKILPFVKVERSVGAASLINSSKNGAHHALLRWSRTLEKAKGFNRELPVHYAGDANQLFLRYRYQSKQIQFGWVAEKDKGEQFFKGAQKTGFDFYSFHVFFNNIGKIRSLAIGDYVMNLGQGLVHWQSMANGKGMQILNAKRQAPVLLPYRSSGEFNFMRGAAVLFRFRNLDITGFASFRKLSASTHDSAEMFSSFNTSSLHRTVNEIAGRNQVGLLTVGGGFQSTGNKGKLGMHAIVYGFSKTLAKNELPYNLFIEQGRRKAYIGFDYSKTYKNIHFYGEFAIDRAGHLAFTNGMIMSVDAKVDLAFHHRKIPKEYLSFFGNAFSENSQPGNEAGLYSGMVLRPVKSLVLSTYFDLFSFPWLKYRVDAPSKGNDFFISFDYQPNRQSSLMIIFRSKQKLQNISEGVIAPLQNHNRRSFRLQISRELSKSLTIRSRVEVVKYQPFLQSNENGFMTYIEPVYKKLRWQTSLRVQWFDIETYNARIYSYETDVLFSSSIHSSNGKGFRYYFNYRFELNTSISISARFSQSIYEGVKSISSGYNEIEGNRKSDLRVQFNLKF